MLIASNHEPIRTGTIKPKQKVGTFSEITNQYVIESESTRYIGTYVFFYNKRGKMRYAFFSTRKEADSFKDNHL